MLNLCEAGHDTHRTIRVQTTQGDMWVYDHNRYKDYKGYCTGQDDVSNTLKNNQIWEKEETELIKSILEHGDRNLRVMDIGAHVGWYSLLAGKLGYSVTAIEAEGQSCGLIEKNTVIHGVGTQMTILNTWIDAKTKTNKDLKDLELIKIDIEGNEQYAIRLCEDVIKRRGVKYIVMEVSPCFNDSYPALIQKLVDYGYTPYELNMQPFDFKYNFDQTNLLFIRNENE